MNMPFSYPRFLHIHSENSETIRKGHLLQWLVVLLVGMSLVRFLLDISRIVTTIPTLAETLPYVFQLIATLIFGGVCLYLIRIGRVIEAAHIFAITLIITFFLLLVTQFQEETGLPYLMLIPVVAIAALDKIRASVVYALAAIAAIAVYTAVTIPYTALDFAFFVLVTIGVSLTTWVTAYDLQAALTQAHNLAHESRQKTELLQQRASQLQHSAQIGQRSGASFDLNLLLSETAQLIKQQFNFYHVSIFLVDENAGDLLLQEAAGQKELLERDAPYRLAIDGRSLIGWAAANQSTRIAGDVATDPHYLAEPLLPQTRSEIALPLVVNNRLSGVLDVQSNRLDAFQEEDVAILQIVANQLAVNIENARLFVQTETALHETRVLYQYNTLLATSLDVGEIYRRAARAMTIELQGIRCLVLAWQSEQQAMAVQIGFEYGIGPERQAGFFWDTAVYPIHDFPHIQLTLNTLETAVYRLNPAQSTPEQKILAAYRAAAILEVPMIRGTELTGLIWLCRSEAKPLFQPAEIQLAQAMANQTAVALSNAQLASDAHVRVAQLSTINRMSVILSHASTLKAIFDGARREIMALIPASGMSITLLSRDGRYMNWLYGYEFGQEVDLSAIPPLPITQGLSGHVIRTREMLHIDKDDVELRQKLHSFVVGEEQAAWLGLPLIVSGEPIGVLAVENEESFIEREIELLKTIVGPLASAIRNFIQLDELHTALEIQSNQRIQLQTAAEVAAAATSVLQLEELVQTSVDLIQQRFSLYYVGLFLVDYEHREAVLVAGTSEAGRLQVQEGHRLRMGSRSLIGGATSDGRPRITQDVSKDEEWLPNPHLPHTRSELALPLQVRDHVIGALTVQSTEINLFAGELIQVLQTLCDQLATAIENARLLARVEARARRQQTLAQISTRLHQTADVEEIIHIGLRAISKHLDGTRVNLHLGNQAGPRDSTHTGQNGEGDLS